MIVDTLAIFHGSASTGREENPAAIARSQLPSTEATSHEFDACCARRLTCPLRRLKIFASEFARVTGSVCRFHSRPRLAVSSSSRHGIVG
jgi:hypothetical protein